MNRAIVVERAAIHAIWGPLASRRAGGHLLRSTFGTVLTLLGAFILGGLAALAPALLQWSTAHATHWPYRNRIEIRSMHSPTQHEDFCVQIMDGSMSFDTARSRLQGTLYLDNPPS